MHTLLEKIFPDPYNTFPCNGGYLDKDTDGGDIKSEMTLLYIPHSKWLL